MTAISAKKTNHLNSRPQRFVLNKIRQHKILFRSKMENWDNKKKMWIPLVFDSGNFFSVWLTSDKTIAQHKKIKVLWFSIWCEQNWMRKPYNGSHKCVKCVHDEAHARTRKKKRSTPNGKIVNLCVIDRKTIYLYSFIINGLGFFRSISIYRGQCSFLLLLTQYISHALHNQTTILLLLFLFFFSLSSNSINQIYFCAFRSVSGIFFPLFNINEYTQKKKKKCTQ